MTQDQKIKMVLNILNDEVNECNDLLENDQESIDVNETENHRDFCLDLIEKLS